MCLETHEMFLVADRDTHALSGNSIGCFDFLFDTNDEFLSLFLQNGVSLKFSDAVKVKANSDFFSKSSAQLFVPGDDERSSL